MGFPPSQCLKSALKIWKFLKIFCAKSPKNNFPCEENTEKLLGRWIWVRTDAHRVQSKSTDPKAYSLSFCAYSLHQMTNFVFYYCLSGSLESHAHSTFILPKYKKTKRMECGISASPVVSSCCICFLSSIYQNPHKKTQVSFIFYLSIGFTIMQHEMLQILPTQVHLICNIDWPTENVKKEQQIPREHLQLSLPLSARPSCSEGY